MPKKISRREFLARLTIALGLPLAFYAGPYRYTTKFEPFNLEISEHLINLNWKEKGIPSLRILHLSDLHFSTEVPLEFIQKSFEEGLKLQPDIAIITGDFITQRILDFDAYKKIFSDISRVVPTFASLGNHDGGLWSVAHGDGYRDASEVMRLLSESGVQVLHNASTIFQIKNHALRLTGLGDILAGYFEPMLAFEKKDHAPVDAHIVLSHNPDTKEALLPYRWDILLCGHTHGGQVKIPFFGAPFAHIRDPRFLEGLHSWQNRHVFVNRGVGNLLGIRFNCPPEIALLKII